MTTLLFLALLILLNAIFVAAEFAMIGAPRHLVGQRAKEGSRKAAALYRLLTDAARQDQYVATAQLGITFASLGLGMYGEHALAHWFIKLFSVAGVSGLAVAHTAASVCAVGILTYLHIVFGEMVPKSLALFYARQSAFALFTPMKAARAVFYPLVICLNSLGNLILRLLGVRVAQPVAAGIPLEELRLIVSESGREGVLNEESVKLLLELFDLTRRSAAEVMVPRIHVNGIPLGASAEELKSVVSIHPQTRYPVYEESIDEIKGVVHVKDLLKRILSGSALEPEDVRKVLFIPTTARLDSFINTMNVERAQFVVVIDEHGGTAGIVALEDIFEEVLDRENTREKSRRPCPIRVPGTLRVDELGEIFGLTLVHPEVVTVSGLVMTLLGRAPQVGDEVQFGKIKLTVTARERMGVAECEATIDELNCSTGNEG